MKIRVHALAVMMLSCASHASDRDALHSLYWELSGEQWERSDGWLSDAPLGEWHGIAARDGQVVEINLAGNGLSGELPHDLEDLPHLESLDLRWNGIRGAIPDSLGELGELKTLLLSGNELSGHIPWSMGSLRNLERLDLSYNRLSGEIPEALVELRSLVALGLQNNQLTGSLPQGLAGIPTLRRIVVSRNSSAITSPREFGQRAGCIYRSSTAHPMAAPTVRE